MKKRITAMLLSAVMLLGLLPAGVLAAEELPFRDIAPGAWYTDAVRYAYDNGMMNGTGEGTFAPEAAITRASVVTLLHRAEKTPEAQGETFSDVVAGSWYDAAVAWASANGIVNGMGDGTFHPEDIITREQFAAIVYRYARFKGVDVTAKADLSAYTDAATVSDYAKDAMAWAVQAGLISGISADQLAPLGSATRAQAATILMRYQTKVAPAAAQPSATPAPTPTPSPSRRPSKGTDSGGGGGGGYRSISHVYIVRDDVDVTGKIIDAGDVLAASVTPSDATYTSSWLVGETEKGTGSTYTVSAMDVGKTITVKVTGTGSYRDDRTSAATGAVRVSTNAGDIYAVDPDAVISPVALTDRENTHFVDSNNDPIDIPSDAKLVLNVEKQDSAVPASGDSNRINVGIIGQVKDANDNPVPNVEVPSDAATVAVDVDLTIVTTAGNETTETAVHPVGETVVTLTRENLGLPADADLNEYVFAASHTNALGAVQSVEGAVVTVEGQDCVRFVLNGLSRIWIGNVPPRTVTFNTDGGTAVESQKVKFGSFAIRPTKNPTKDGWLFAGWDHDLETENIIKDITVKALWVKGTPAADAQLTGAWTKDGVALVGDAPAEAEKANGEVIITLDSKTEYAPNLAYTLTMAAPAGAVNAYVATTAEGAMDSTAAAGPVTIEAQVTDANGAVQLSNKIIYVKWTDADDKLVDLQSARLVVKTELNAPADTDTKTRTETLDVNRGIGTYEFWLTGGKNKAGEAIEDYAGAINGYLNWNGEQYALDLYTSFADSYYITNTTASAGSGTTTGGSSGSSGGGGSRERIRSTNYTTLKAVATPFEGQSFSAVPTVEGWYWDNSGEKSVRKTWDVTATLEEGKLVFTCPILRGEDVGHLMMDISMEGDKNQQLEFWFGNWTEDNTEEPTYQSFTTWEETLAAIAAHEYDQVAYRGETDVTLTTPITLDVDQELIIRNANLTIGAGGSVTMKGTYGAAADLDVYQGSLTIAEGGKIVLPSQPEDVSSHRHCGVHGQKGVTVARGGAIEIADNAYLSMRTRNGGFVVEEGGAVSSAGILDVMRNDSTDAKNIIAGTVTATGGRLEFNDGLTVAATGHLDVSSDYYESLRVYGGLTVEEGGMVDFASTYKYNRGYNGLLSGRTVNAGTINVKSGTLFMPNTAFSTANMGTITVAEGAKLDTNGTVLINTGSITGEGAILAGEYEDVTDYDNHNGLEWVEIEPNTDSTPANHERYAFTYAPAETVEAIYYLGEVSNQDGGTCTVNVTE